LPIIKFIIMVITIIIIINKRVYVDRAIKESYLIDLSILNSHSLYSTITGKLKKYTDIKEKSTTIWQNAYYVVPLVLSTTGIVPNKSHDGLKLLILRPGLYIVT